MKKATMNRALTFIFIVYSQTSLNLNDAGYDTIIPPINALHFHDHLYLARKGLLSPTPPCPLSSKTSLLKM